MISLLHCRAARYIATLFASLIVLLGTAGCLEQYQSTRVPGGAVFNFFLHLRNGEMEDARAYFAPGLVDITPELDQALLEASNRVKRYDARKIKVDATDLPDGEKQVTLTGEVRLRTASGQTTPGPDGWQTAEIMTARVVERGPGWRILEYEVVCCPR